jgi:hypothetical protein
VDFATIHPFREDECIKVVVQGRLHSFGNQLQGFNDQQHGRSV